MVLYSVNTYLVKWCYQESHVFIYCIRFKLYMKDSLIFFCRTVLNQSRRRPEQTHIKVEAFPSMNFAYEYILDFIKSGLNNAPCYKKALF